jgi:hypothetical protein
LLFFSELPLSISCKKKFLIPIISSLK